MDAPPRATYIRLAVSARAIIESIGASVIRAVEDFGALVSLGVAALVGAFRPPLRLGLLFAQLDFIGVGSLFIVGLTGLFTGLVLALQAVYAFSIFNAESMVGATVELSLSREIAPVFTALFVTARVGSAIATELGTMRVTEQIDALETMAVNPVQYLITPRVVAGTLMAPVLTMFFNSLALFGCWVVAVPFSHISSGTFWTHLQRLVDAGDILQGLAKSVVFGFALTTIACARGYRAEGGARGVGIATTQAVVLGSVSILLIDVIITALQVSGGHG